jgi:hypothetical protein
MNRLLIILSLVLLVSCDTSEGESSLVATIPYPLHSKIVGEWQGTDGSGASASFVFSENRDVKMIIGNLVIDTETVGAKVSWQLDTNQDPMQLDIVTGSSVEDGGVTPLIIRFVTDNKIQLRISEDGTSRPVGFSSSDTENQIVLTRR